MFVDIKIRVVMIERFQGTRGHNALIDSLMQQSLVMGNRQIAERMVELGELIQVLPGNTLMTQGGNDDDVYFIITGRFRMSVYGREISVRGPNEHIGEMAVVLPTLPRSATGTAIDHAIALKLTSANFSDLCDEFTNIWRQLARHLAKRLHQRNDLVRPAHESSRVFIICSVEALPIARSIENHFEHDKFFVKVWTEGVFRASAYSLDSLEAQLDESDFAIAIAQPDDETVIRGVTSRTPRDNVIFELGMFVGRIGRERSFLLEPKGEEVKLPSDLSGLTTIGYRTGNDKDLSALLGPTCNQLRNRFLELGPR